MKNKKISIKEKETHFKDKDPVLGSMLNSEQAMEKDSTESASGSVTLKSGLSSIVPA